MMSPYPYGYVQERERRGEISSSYRLTLLDHQFNRLLVKKLKPAIHRHGYRWKEIRTLVTLKADIPTLVVLDERD